MAYLPDVHGFVDLNGGLAAKTVKIPWPTSWPATPRTASITDQCPECVTEYRLRGSPSTVRDF
ncbi:hypothetical protein AB0L88_34200 [Saccharopolyspora shandongensis]|uniref:hypothetical protein n=1 Tax=Saccharopolyspora shandongensis TaxID=418495 RepID=UPI00341D7425